jgi:siroheme synthase (precorrin-2 oxidase/ferrochelatase)
MGGGTCIGGGSGAGRGRRFRHAHRLHSLSSAGERMRALNPEGFALTVRERPPCPVSSRAEKIHWALGLSVS